MQTMKDPRWIHALCELDACAPAIDYCRRQGSLEKAWRLCDNSEWLWWVLLNLGNYRAVEATQQTLRVLYKYDCEHICSVSADDIRECLPVPTLEDLERATQEDYPWEAV